MTTPNIAEMREKVTAWATARKTELFIVCIDDDPGILEILKETIEQTGFRYLTFTGPQQALPWLADHAWQTALVISDFNMPEIDGFEFNRRLGAGSQVPFVILSAHVDRDLALTAVECKIAAFLSKPTNTEELISLLEKEAVPRASSISDELELVQGFVDDARGLLDQIEPLVLGFEESPNDREALNSLYGMVHTIKGSSGFFEPKTMHNFVHKFEDRLKQIQASSAPVSAGAVGMMLKANDIIRSLLGELERHEHVTKDIAPLLACLEFDETQATQAGGEESHGAAAGEKEKAAKANELRVDVVLLDQFVQASGEMTVIRNMITKSVQAIEKSYKSDRDVQMLAELLEEFHKINASVQAKIADLRKVPVRTVVKSLPRIIRDLSKSLGKKVSFTTVGDDLRVDTAVIDALSKSLVHLVRNSLDHGLERTEDRGAKDPTGRIEIKSYIKDEHVFVEISDDGRGINTKRVREKALSMSLVPKARLDAMSTEEIHLLIFESGCRFVVGSIYIYANNFSSDTSM